MREAAALALEVVTAEELRLLDQLTEVRREKRLIRMTLGDDLEVPTRARGPDDLEIMVDFVLAELRQDTRGLRSAEVVDRAKAAGFVPIALATNPRLAALAALRELEKAEKVYRAAHGRWKLKVAWR